MWRETKIEERVGKLTKFEMGEMTDNEERQVGRFIIRICRGENVGKLTSRNGEEMADL